MGAEALPCDGCPRNGRKTEPTTFETLTAVAQVRRVAGGIHEPPESVAVIEDDPTDNRILECALAADAEFVVTGDKKHLLPLGSFRGVSIVGLADFLASFSTADSLSRHLGE